MPNLPPAIAVGALYDQLLQSALRQFFERATLESEAVPSPSSDGRLAIEPTGDPAALAIRWFGNRYTLRVGRERPFTLHEVRFARAIGAVLSARYRAMLSPALMVSRSDLFLGAMEDRYVGAFFDDAPYALAPGVAVPRDRVALAIEMMRTAALSTYENQPISTGVLLLGTDADPLGRYPVAERGPQYSGALTSIKSFYRLADGLRTVFLVSREGWLLDIVDIKRWADLVSPDHQLDVPGAQTYLGHAGATLGGAHVCVVLSPRQEIKVFAEGAEIFSFRHADWRLLDLRAKAELWRAAVRNDTLADQLFRAALDLADARHGALFVVLRRPGDSLPQLVAAQDRLDMELVERRTAGPSPHVARNRLGGPPSRSHLLHLLAGRVVTELDPNVLEALATLDGATVTDTEGTLLAVGAILRHPLTSEHGKPSGITEGARTTAAIAASRFGPVLKVSEDGMVSFYDQGRIWDL
jgi:DNA integrity scanning protein DisA with diadenylate cyclase activity